MVCGAEFRAETHALCSKVKGRNMQFPKHYPHMPMQQSERQKYAISRALSAYAYSPTTLQVFSSCSLLAYLKIANFPSHPSIIAEGGTGRQEQNKQLQANRASTMNRATGYWLTQPQLTPSKGGTDAPVSPDLILIAGRPSRRAAAALRP